MVLAQVQSTTLEWFIKVYKIILESKTRLVILTVQIKLCKLILSK